MKMILGLGCVCVYAWALAWGAWGDEAIGRVTSLDGTAMAFRGNQEIALQIKAPIYLQDRLVTEAGARIQVLFNDDSLVSLGENSELLVDEYVYNPKNKKESSCSLRFIRGLLRVITGTITDTNPEQFKVNTRHATIGIRGCELGFRSLVNGTEVYIIELPPGKRILIETEEPSVAQQDRSMLLAKQGIMVAIIEGAGLQQRETSPTETLELQRETTPAALENPISSRQTRSSPVDQTVQAAKEGQAGVLEQQVEDSIPAQVQASAASAAPQTQSSYGNLQPPPVNPPPENVTPDPAPAGKLVAQGGGPMSDWYWGIWDDGAVKITGNFLSPTDFQQIISDGSAHNLTGSGEAGAWIKQDGQGGKLVAGACNLNVYLQQGAANRWDGTYIMNGGGNDHLSFEVNSGSIDNDGNLTAAQVDNYIMRVNNTTYGTPSSQSVNGRLTGSGGANPNISGAAGKFTITHTGGGFPDAQINGAFGANLTPVASQVP